MSAIIFLSCNGDDAPPAEAVFVLPRDGVDSGFFDLPWPTDVRRTADGMIDVRAFPNPRGPTSTLGAYLDAISTRLDGYGTNSGAYLRFSASVDPSSLPETAEATLDEDASVFLLDLEDGARHPATITYQDEATIYWSEHTVAVHPVWGLPLRPRRTYAAVVTTSVVAESGGAFLRSPDLAALIDGGGDATVDGAREIYGPALDAVEAAGVPRDRVLSLAVFTTQDPVGELAEMRDWMIDQYPLPEAPDRGWRWIETNDDYTLVEGVYFPAPNFQTGPAPYDEVGSGEIVVEDGVPVVAEEYEARFMLTVPNTEMPPEGYPVVLYAHGTGGDYRSFVRNDVGKLLSRAGYAVIGIDQVLHGDRNPTSLSPELLFFNFLNPMAARDNNRQAALDAVQQSRFAQTVEIPERIIGAAGGPLRRFDPNRIYIYGHSQGGLNLPLFMAIDDSSQGGMLSGAGGLLSISVIEKTEPLSIASAVQLFLVLPGSSPSVALAQESFSYTHPVLSLLQTWIEVSDGVNYGPLIFDRPRDGFAPKSVMMTGGQLDEYTSANANAALAGSMAVPLVMPIANDIEANVLRGIAVETAPVRGNVADGAATAGLLQFPMDGHFVAFTNDNLRARILSYFQSFEDGIPTIPAFDMVDPLDAGVTTDAGMDSAMDAGDASTDGAADASSDGSSDGAPGDAALADADAGAPDV